MKPSTPLAALTAMSYPQPQSSNMDQPHQLSGTVYTPSHIPVRDPGDGPVWARWAERLMAQLGVPTAILAVLGYALWSAAAWAKPWAEQVATSHLEFVNAATERLDELEVTNAVLIDTNHKLSQMLDEIRRDR